ncbi:penicillin-binding protein [Macrococcoides caseolyticum]|uniref:penicillin-binding protein n=1 Tax=Macrococcoides caseolyticum TaxID=69966 RepID=UPI0011A74FA9|nr:penicillin-binding transpeptidase domain-containing protein [Macrococcus caseolyticus]MDJ1088671.1 penicillin-binding transpeptidase domain-containing protein [Macrococcus caseolyticus]MDJ1154314.1 penicillin-binding transpeptidase domain-containing protein [Macrococcus caseolyticus]
MSRSKLKLKKNKIGAVLLIMLFGLLFFSLIFKYGMIMLTGKSSGQDLEMRASEKYVRNIVNQPERGKILDRNGQVLAEDIESYKLVAILDKRFSEGSKKPRHVVNKKKTAKALADIIDMDEKDIYKVLSNKKAFQVEFGKAGKDLTFEQKQKIQNLKMPGLTFFSEKKRFYPNGNFASHLIGFAEKNGDTNVMTGMLGSEKIFDSYLSGKPGKTTFKQDIWNYVLPKSGNVVPAQDGDDVTLTIDKNIQIFVEDSLDMMVKRYKPKDIFAVVMDAKTGEILGSSQRPTFNPQTREGFGEKWANDLYQNTYEPGSTFKTFGLAAAIEENQYDPKAKYESGEREIDGITISDWNDVGWGTITMSKGFQLSSNVLMMKLQDKVGIDKMKTYYEKFGFGRSTQSLFDSEASGHISWNDELSQKVSSFGQSTTVTPAQMLQAESAIVNEGKMLKPYFVKSIKSQDNNNIYTGKKDITGQPISKSTAQKTMQQLYEVVNGKEMHAINYGLKDYKVAGKTGTAQVPDTEKGGYVQGANPYMVSFMGYAPAKDPEVIIYYGMSLAQKNDAEAYAQGVSKGYTPLMENTLKYLNVGSPDKDNAKLIFNTPDVIGSKDDKASTEIENASLKPVRIGNGRTVTNQLPAKGTKLLADDKVFILTEGAKVMPDITGWSKRDLLMFSTLTGIEIQFKGNGYAINQSIDVNNPIKQGDKLTVELDSLDPLKQSPVYNDVIKAQLQQEKEVLKEQIKDEKQKNSN